MISVIVCLLVAIIVLLAYVVYCISTPVEPTDETLEEFPAEQILQDFEQGFDNLIEEMKMKRMNNAETNKEKNDTGNHDGVSF